MKIFGQIILAILAPWTSKRLWMTIIGLLFLNSMFWTGVYYLYSFTDQWKAEIYFKMFALVIGACVTAIMGYLGFQTFGNGAASSATNVVQTIIEKGK